MFEQMKAMGALAGLMKNRERMAEVADEFKRRVERISASGEAGGGAVLVEVDGKMRVTSVRLDPSLLAGRRRTAGGARWPSRS
jgi:DNA-binding protein YbaB